MKRKSLQTMKPEDNKRSVNSLALNNSPIRIGMRIEMRFADRKWYEVGAIDKITRGKDGKIVKVIISFDDGDKEEHDWPNKDIAVIAGAENVEDKKAKRATNATEEGNKDA